MAKFLGLKLSFLELKTLGKSNQVYFVRACLIFAQNIHTHNEEAYHIIEQQILIFEEINLFCLSLQKVDLILFVKYF